MRFLIGKPRGISLCERVSLLTPVNLLHVASIGGSCRTAESPPDGVSVARSHHRKEALAEATVGDAGSSMTHRARHGESSPPRRLARQTLPPSVPCAGSSSWETLGGQPSTAVGHTYCERLLRARAHHECAVSVFFAAIIAMAVNGSHDTQSV